MSRQIRPEEQLAADVLAELLDAQAIPHDDGTAAGQYDWTMKLADGTYIALEVTAHNDENWRAYFNMTNRGKHYREIAGLGGYWLFRVHTWAKLNVLWPRLPDLIRGFPEGITDMELVRRDPNDPKQDDAIQLAKLGVQWVIFQASHEHSAMMASTGSGGAIHPNVAAAAALSEVDVNRVKLAAATDAVERHLFVWIDSSANAAHWSMDDAMHLPTEPLDLGESVDVLWVGLQDHSAQPARLEKL